MTKFELVVMAILVALLIALVTSPLYLRAAAPPAPPASPPCTGATIAGRECIVCTQVGGHSVTAIDCR